VTLRFDTIHIQTFTVYQRKLNQIKNPGQTFEVEDPRIKSYIYSVQYW